MGGKASENKKEFEPGGKSFWGKERGK